MCSFDTYGLWTKFGQLGTSRTDHKDLTDSAGLLGASSEQVCVWYFYSHARNSFNHLISARYCFPLIWGNSSIYCQTQSGNKTEQKLPCLEKIKCGNVLHFELRKRRINVYCYINIVWIAGLHIKHVCFLYDGWWTFSLSQPGKYSNKKSYLIFSYRLEIIIIV